MAGISVVQSPGLQEMQAMAASLTDAALTDNAGELRRIAADMRIHVRGIENDLAAYRRAARGLPAMVASSTREDVDLAVDELLRKERTLQQVSLQTARLCRKLEAKARQLRPAIYPLVRQITTAAESWHRPYLKFLRDARWEIMALQAEQAPEADGLILAGGSDVDAYFRSLPPAA